MDVEYTDNYESYDDKALGLAFREGDTDAFDEIVRRYQGRLYGAAFRITGNREDALDVAQEALLKVYTRIHAWKPTGGFLAWMVRITTNHAIDFVRSRKRRRHDSLDEGFLSGSVAEPLISPGVDTVAQVQLNELESRIRDGLVLLSPMQRKVFVARHFEEFSLAEIAEDLDCSVGCVKVHLFRAVKKMRAHLKDVYPE
jgi:RNA polymerase sigma-70 factor (ECF subfamily)